MIAHLLASTTAALVAVAVCLAVRREAAGWRHALLFAALVRFAIPTAWFARAGDALATSLPSRFASLFSFAAVDDIRSLLLHPGGLTSNLAPSAAPHASALTPWALVWAAGLAGCLALWARHWLTRIPAVRPPDTAELAALRQAAYRLHMETRIDLRITAPDRVPGACGVWRPVVILPDGLSAQLSDAELQSVLAHELAHVRRRDNLSAAIAHLIVSAFWFHPLVWWMERRMLAERETACDDLALSSGASPEDYLSGILKVYRLAFAGAAGYAGINGSNLRERMEGIMSGNLRHSSSRLVRAGLVTIFAGALLAPVAGTLLMAQQPQGQAPLNSNDLLFQRGVAHLAANEFRDAERDFREYQRLNPQSIRGLLGVVETYSKEYRHEDAIALLQSESARQPDRTDLQIALANTYVRAGHYDDAIAAYQKVLALLPAGDQARADIYLRLGETYRRKGDDDQAATALGEARKLAPQDEKILNELALVLDHAGRRKEAGDVYEAVLRVNPDNAVAHNNLAYLLAETGGDLDAALNHAKRAVELLPKLSESKDTLGWIYLKRGEYDKAIEAFRAVLETSPDNPEYRRHLTLALDKQAGR